MSVPGNFQFSLYLKESGLSEQERFNLERIFSALLPERQVEILEAWPKYLDKLLEIKQYADEERKRSIASAFDRIEKLISDAELRAQEKKERSAEEEREFQRNLIGSEEYERGRRLEALKKIGRPAETPPQTIIDPLADFL